MSDPVNTLEARLYDALISNFNADKIQTLINEGVDCNASYFDYHAKEFQSLIELAETNETILCLLLENRKQLTKQQLQKHLNFYLNQYDPQKEIDNKKRIYIIISRLLYVKISKFKEKNFSILFAGINDIDNGRQHGTLISTGSTQALFLVLRIYTLVHEILRMYTDINQYNNNKVLTLLTNELLQNLETYYLLHDIACISIDFVNQTNCYTSIAKNIIKKLQQLEINQEYTIPTGWFQHAVCISFRRINESHIHIRVDNSSSSNPPNIHDTTENTDSIKPKILGHLNVNHLNNNLEYFILLINSVKQELPFTNGTILIYNLNNQIKYLETSNIENIRSFRKQANYNCFLKCFEPGFRLRLGNENDELCERIFDLDSSNARLLSKSRTDGHFSSININQFYIKYASFNDEMLVEDANRLQKELKQSYQCFQSLITTEKYIPLTFKKFDKSILNFEDLLNESHAILLADFGVGKTTMCQYITYRWSIDDLWNDRFDWLFYIKLRNLNRRSYPIKTEAYSLIDIIEKECFQGVTLSYLDKQKLKIQFEVSSKILWILDGLDEQRNEDHLFSIEQDLLKKSKLLVTSRPTVTYDLYPVMKIYLQGFSSKDIRLFIENYFSKSPENKTNECNVLIDRASNQFSQIASIPLCLKMICNLWKKNRNLSEDIVTIENLYEKMCEYLLRQYLNKFYDLDTTYLTMNNIIQHPNVRFIDLEIIAFEITKTRKLTIDGSRIAELSQGNFLSVIRIGLLVSQSGDESYLIENDYQFIHRSFQEYLCARYMIRILTTVSFETERERNDVMKFIADEKYEHSLQHTFRFFFNMQPSRESRNHFWTAIDNKPRDLVGFRHCSRIIQWFSDSPCSFLDEEDNINQRSTDFIIKNWIMNTNRSACDYANIYIFETFLNIIPHYYWLTAWENDLSIEDRSKRRYFLSDVWLENNIEALRNVYNTVNKNINIEKLFRLIKKGPTNSNLQSLGLDIELFTLPSIDNSIEISELLIEARKKSEKRQAVTNSEEFEQLLNNYQSFAKFNRQAELRGLEVWRLKIAPSALIQISQDTLKLLFELTKENQLFYRDFELPVIPFLRSYVSSTDSTRDILCSLIVSISFSNPCIIAALPNETRSIRVHENHKSIDIELSKDRWNQLTQAFNCTHY